MVNGTKMDPMRVRIPQSKELKGKDLENFEYQVSKITAVLNGQTPNHLINLNSDDS